MPARTFGFVPENLLEDANSVGDHFEGHGYSVKVDHQLTAAPSVPTLYAKRNKTEIVALVMSAIDRDRVKNWCAYAKSTGRDFRVCCVLPRKVKVKASDAEFMRQHGAGLLRKEADADTVVEEIVAKDLGLTVTLPTLQSLRAKSRKHLGPAYEQFQRSQWREGFEDACQALENLARDYLVGEIKQTRVTQFIRKNGPVAATVTAVKKMTLGQLAHAFAEIPNQNQTDAQLAQILPKLNKDRVAVVHYKNRTATETRLRKNVGMHMWSIIGAIKLLT